MATTDTPTTQVSISGKGRGQFRWEKAKEAITGYLFVAPAVLLISVFGLIPIGYAFYMSLHRWRVRKGDFKGIENYTDIIGDWKGLLFFLIGVGLLVLAYWIWNKSFKSISNRRLIVGVISAFVIGAAGLSLVTGWNRMLTATTKDFLPSLIITLYYALGSVPLQLGLGMILAFLLYQNIRGKEVFRMIYFLPYVTPVVAASVVFRSIFSPRATSIANQAIGLLGITPQDWLFESKPIMELLFGWEIEGFLAGPSLALISIILYGVWTYVGYDAIIFLAGLGSIPGELYEAAEIDGASKMHQFRHITLPLLSPVTFYLSMIATIGTLKAFNHIYVMRTPSTLGTVDTASIVIFDTFYKANQFGLATAQAILLFFVILGLTQVQNSVFGKRVFYG
nr:sugar ABC transporter permease [Anaerolineae bacterium]